MHNFRRAVCMTLAFLICLFAATVALTEPYFQTEPYSYQDAKARDAFAGSIDTVYLGASQAYRALIPSILDEKLGTSSYNLSCALMTLPGRYYMLKKEMDRNPIKRVIIDVTYDTLTRDPGTEGAEGDIYTIGRIGNLWERIGYVLRYVPMKQYMRVYYDALDRGIYTWKTLGNGQESSEAHMESRGFVSVPTNDVTASPDVFDQTYQQFQAYFTPREENLKQLHKILDLCNENGVEVTLMVMPLADACNYRYFDMDQVYAEFQSISEEYGYQYYDFNLLKGKIDALPDSTAFYDETHLSEDGAKVFSNIVADILLKQAQGIETDSLFYSSYDEMNDAVRGWH